MDNFGPQRINLGVMRQLRPHKMRPQRQVSRRPIVNVSMSMPAILEFNSLSFPNLVTIDTAADATS